jgi:ABC-type amino acid transport system permease subunit
MRSHASARVALFMYGSCLEICTVRAGIADEDVGVEAAAAALGVESASLSAASISTGFPYQSC